MGKSILIIVVALPLALISCLIGWLSTSDIKNGLIIGLIVYGILFALSIIRILFFVKEISWLDVFLPIPVAVIWYIVLLPFDIPSFLTHFAAFAAAAVFLTGFLWIYKLRKISQVWVILPFLVFFWEMFPLHMPGSLDEIIGVTGDAGTLLARIIVGTISYSGSNTTRKITGPGNVKR